MSSARQSEEPVIIDWQPDPVDEGRRAIIRRLLDLWRARSDELLAAGDVLVQVALDRSRRALHLAEATAELLRAGYQPVTAAELDALVAAELAEQAAPLRPQQATAAGAVWSEVDLTDDEEAGVDEAQFEASAEQRRALLAELVDEYAEPARSPFIPAPSPSVRILRLHHDLNGALQRSGLPIVSIARVNAEVAELDHGRAEWEANRPDVVEWTPESGS